MTTHTRPHTCTVDFTINGQSCTVAVPPMRRLLDVLRQDLRLTGTKEGCGEGECGSCSVLLDGGLVNSCLVPALQVHNKTVHTVEALGSAAHLHPIQQCFLTQGGAQCGICTPGMMLATQALLQQHPDPTDEQIREGLAGNLCRCTGYVRIFAAVRAAANLLRSETGGTSCLAPDAWVPNLAGPRQP